jgi:hypothetical protein
MAVIREVIHILRNAPRSGQETDDPEGVRYIQLSDTLANQLADRLEAHLLMRDHDAVRCPVCGGDMRDRMEMFGLR